MPQAFLSNISNYIKVGSTNLLFFSSNLSNFYRLIAIAYLFSHSFGGRRTKMKPYGAMQFVQFRVIYDRFLSKFKKIIDFFLLIDNLIAH